MSALRALQMQLRSLGPVGMARLALQNRLRRRLRLHELCARLLSGGRGLEIGGPSPIFTRTGLLPLYPLLASLDGCDFAGSTIWHGEADDGTPYVYDVTRPPGRRFVRDATDLDGIADDSYDVVLSSHTLEHIANPRRALVEWQRVLTPAGHLVLVVPHLENTFDHRRPVTALAHLEDDFTRGTREDDETHVREFIQLCDLSRVPDPLSRRAFEERTLAFGENRTLHHHVFDTDLVVRLLDRAGFRILGVETALPFHVVALAASDRAKDGNGAFLSPRARWRRESVFARDRAYDRSARS